MKTIDQAINDPKKGDCFAACIASILEIPLKDIPNIAWKSGWSEEFNKWLFKNHGLRYVEFDLMDDSYLYTGDTYHTIYGESPNFNCSHIVVGYSGKMVHDPASSKKGLKKVKGYGFFIKMFPKG